MQYKLPVRISHRGWDAVGDLCGAHVDLVLAEKQSAEAEDAYVSLVMRKHELLTYISQLEFRLRIAQTTQIIQSPFRLPDLKRLTNGPEELNDPDRHSPYRPGSE